jgi:hypothetical protein
MWERTKTKRWSRNRRKRILEKLRKIKDDKEGKV